MCRLKIVGKRCLRVRRKMLGFAEAIWQGGAIISNLHQVVRGHMCLVLILLISNLLVLVLVLVISNLHQVVHGHMCLVIRLY